MWLLLLPMGLWAQTCPYVRYILIDACTDGNEGNDELLIFYTPVDFNINDLQITFPNPAGTVWCYTDCGANNFTCTSTNNTVAYLNANACAGTTFTCPAAGTTIPANSFILLFTGNSVTNNYPNPSALCGAGTVYVLFVNQNNTAGRYLNNPNSNQNRRTIITFTGAPACNMTVNYRGSISGANGNYLLVDPNICIGLTSGANANDGTQPPAGSCAYRGTGGGGPSNGVSLANIGAGCALPGIGILPILWQEVKVVGNRLRWRVLVEGDQVGPVTLWHRVASEAAPYILRTGLLPEGEVPIERAGYYHLTIEQADGRLLQSPTVWYEGQRRPFVRWEGRLPVIEWAESIQTLTLWDGTGRILYQAQGAMRPDFIREVEPLAPGLYFLSMTLKDGRVQQERLLLMP